jgi:hypothetical protein
VELASYTFKFPTRDKPFVIRPLGDIQYTGHDGTTAMDLLKRDIEEALDLNAWFVGMGDYTDFMSPSNRQRIKAAALYETASDVIDNKALDLTHELFQKALKPTVGRWLGLCEGHHYHDMAAGDTTDMRLCTMLKARHLGSEAVIRLQFSDGVASRSNVVIHAHHGVGGGATQAASLNKLENTSKAWEDVDIYLRGHDTKMPVTPINKMKVRWHGKNAPDLEHRSVYLVNTGSYSKSRVVNSRQGQVPRGGYAERGAMNANVLGSPLIFIQYHRAVRDVGSRRAANYDRKQEAITGFRVRVQV